MCFYDQHRFSCGDWEWAQFREHCPREYRPGETCGLRLIWRTINVEAKCDICDQIHAEERQCTKELDSIFHWEQDGPAMATSIARSYDTIKALRSNIGALVAERQTGYLSLIGVVNKTLETDDLKHKVQDPLMTLRVADQPEKAAASVGTEAQVRAHSKRKATGPRRADLEAARSSGEDEPDLAIVSPSTNFKQSKKPALSEHAYEQIQKHMIDPILKDTTLKDSHLFLKAILDRMKRGDIKCLQDLEEPLIWLAPDPAHAVAKDLYFKFRQALLRCVLKSIAYLDDDDRRRPRDSLDATGYLFELREQVRFHAAILAADIQVMASSEIVSIDEEALKPGLEKEVELEVKSNSSPSSSGQLSKSWNPISSSAYHAIGGLNGLEKGPDSDTVGDFPMDKEYFDGALSFDNAEIAPEDVASTKGVKRRAASPPYVTSQDRRKLFPEGSMFHSRPEYDSDGDSVVSVNDSIFSTATNSSQSSAESLEAVGEFFGVLIRDTRIRSLFPEALSIMDAEKVERNFVRLLQLYARDLRLEAKSTFEKGASRLVRRYSAPLALRITRCFDRGRSCFAEGQGLEETTAPLVMDMINLPEADDSEDSGAEEVDQFAKVRFFMVGGTPFLKLRDNFQNFLNTVWALSRPLPTREVRHLMTTTSIQGVSGVHQLKEVFLLREPNSILGLNSSNDAVFFCTFSSVPIQPSTPLVYYLNLFRDYAACGDSATGVAEWLHLDVSSPIFHTAAHQFWIHSQKRDGLPIAKNTTLSYLRYGKPGEQLSPEMTTSDPFYSLNVFFSNIALSEMAFLNKMRWECESDLYKARIHGSTSFGNMLSRKEVLDLHMKMLERNLHSITNRAVSDWTQDSEAGDWSQADAMTQRLQVDFEYLLLRTKDLSTRYDQSLSTVMHCATAEESRTAISHNSRFINLLQLSLVFALLYMVSVALFVVHLGFLVLVDTASTFSNFSSCLGAYIERLIDCGRHHRAGASGRTRTSTDTRIIGIDRSESELIETSSQRPQAVHKIDGAGKSKCVVSSASEDALGRPGAPRICQKIAKRLSTMDGNLVLGTAMMCVAVVPLFIAISRGDTASIRSPEPRDVYYCVDSLFSVGAGCYKVSVPSPKWSSIWVDSSLPYEGARLLNFVAQQFMKVITNLVIPIFCLNFLTSSAINEIRAPLLYLWKSLLSKHVKLRCQHLLAFARLRDIRARGVLSTRALAERLGVREVPIEDGMKRVRWTCRCGQRLYDDFIELRPGAAKEMAYSLNRAMSTRASHDTQKRGQRISLGTRAMSALSGFLSLNRSLATGNGLPRYNPKLQSRDQGLANPSSQPEGRWLLVCARIGTYATKLSHMDVCATISDKDLFTELRKAYIDLRSRWTQLFTLRGIKSIRFVQFELHRKELVDIRKVPDMPSGERRKEYLYETCELLPPLGENYMMHLFHHPEDGGDESLTCLRVPKKRREKLKVCQQRGIGVGWGLHLVEGWLLNRVWILVLVLFALGSLVFGICWSVLKHDIQGAFGVSAWMVALAMIVAGTVQAQLD